uniref:Protein phosphatase 1 regulatory subunit 21 n=1 Tax=Pygocentrus nattereri TaxID=42514 RepID=A0AAR2J765_PYGNA
MCLFFLNIQLRAQNQVLKKAVVDEQANSNSLKEELKQREQCLRKAEQEMDSLNFRNQQLAKRVELLQEELLTSEAKGKKSKVSLAESLIQSSSVFDEDLQKKIQENERLHIQFYEADELHRQQEAQLRARLQQLEKDAEQHQTVVDNLTSKYMDTIEKLQSEKARLELGSDCVFSLCFCSQQQLRKYQTELSSQLKHNSSVIQEKVPFNDTTRDAAGQAVSFIQDLVSALLNFHSYTEQRVHIYPLDSSIESISPLNQKFSQYLHENAAYVRPLEDGLLQLHQSITEDTVTVLETVSKLQDFSKSFSTYTSFLQKILPYQLKSFEEECEVPLCTASLNSKNRELQNDLKALTAVFEKLQNYISLLALPSESCTYCHKTTANHYTSSAVFTQLAACLHGLHDTTKELSKHYSQKVTLEQELPTVTQKLRTTNECLLSSLASLTNSTGKTRPETVPYTEALSNRRILTSSTESREGLMQQVQQSQEKIARLEQEKEHWLLEAQLARVRLEKESQRIVELEAQLSAALGGDSVTTTSSQTAFLTPECTDPETEEKTGREVSHSTSVVGMLTTTPTNEIVGDEESREHLIKTHYMTRVADLTTQLQMSDSKAVHFHAECRALAKRLTIAEKSRETLTEEVKQANQNITRLQDELSTTKRSYEDQLSMMSDHLCSMNETLSKQREEIDTLKLGNKVRSLHFAYS